MFKILVEKELKAILSSPKFMTTFAVCSLLILLSIFIGIQSYEAATAQYDSAVQLNEQQLRESGSFGRLSNRLHRKPDPMQIFVSGVHHDIGRISSIKTHTQPKLTNSIYSDEPVYAIFRFIDFSFIVQVVFSLFAILFTYDAVCGEKEGGTLKLVFSNAIPRAQYILAKLTGSVLGLFIPLLIPIILGLLMIIGFGVPFTAANWLQLLLLLGCSFLFFLFFMALGLLVSTLTRNASISFLFLLVSWVAFVLIIPRASVMAAAQFVHVPSVSELESQQDGYAKMRWQQHSVDLGERWQARNAAAEALDESERAAFRDDSMWQWMTEDDELRKAMQADINENYERLTEDFTNRKIQQERLAFLLSRFSPTSAFTLAAMNLAGTNINLKKQYETAIQTYRKQFLAYKEKKQEESGDSGNLRIEISEEAGLKINTGRDKGTLDVSDMPRFVAPVLNISEAVSRSIIDFGLLCLYTLTAFAGAFVVFLRYDVR